MRCNNPAPLTLVSVSRPPKSRTPAQMNPGDSLPYLRASAAQHQRCAERTWSELPRLDSRIPRSLQLLDRLLLLLDGLASCMWGCHGQEHAIEYLVGRSVSNGRAAMRLIEFGHYDEAIAVTRTIAETGNLLWLFYLEPSNIRQWLDLTDGRKRSDAFGPAGVRKKIAALGSVLPHDRDSYGLLCEIGVHPAPNRVPQGHNREEVPTLGGHYQESGFTVSSVTLAWALATVAGPAAKLAILERAKAEAIVEATIELAEAIPPLEDIAEVTRSSDDILEVGLRRKGVPRPEAG